MVIQAIILEEARKRNIMEGTYEKNETTILQDTQAKIKS